MLIERDGGFVCFYCKKQLDYKTAVFDHLNNNDADNRLDNLVLACQSCNIKKIGDNTMRLQAYEKMELNEFSIFVGEKKYSSDNAIDEETPEVSKEIDINTTNFQITEQYIEEVTQTKGSILFREALDSCVYLCKKKTGHGSQQSVRNYLSTLTSSVAPFEVIRGEDGKKVIVKRAEIKEGEYIE